MTSGPTGSKIQWAQYVRVPKAPADAAVTGPQSDPVCQGLLARSLQELRQGLPGGRSDLIIGPYLWAIIGLVFTFHI